MVALIFWIYCTSHVRASCVADLRAEQWTTQQDKFKCRTLEEYDWYFTQGAQGKYGQLFREVTHLRDGERWVDYLRRWGRRRTRPLGWADVGAGHAIAMRELACDHGDLPVRRTAVDLFDWDEIGSDDGDVARARFKGRAVFAPRFKPGYVLGDATTAVPFGQDLITSVEMIQYLPDVIKALVEWHNRLAPGGLLIVAAEHHWSDYAFGDDRPRYDYTLLSRVIAEMQALGVRVATRGDPGRVHTLALRRRAGLHLDVRVRPYFTEPTRHGYVRAHYSLAEHVGPLLSPTDARASGSRNRPPSPRDGAQEKENQRSRR